MPILWSHITVSDITDLAAIERLFALLRAHNVEEFSANGLSVRFGAAPQPSDNVRDSISDDRRVNTRGLPAAYFDPALGLGVEFK